MSDAVAVYVVREDAERLDRIARAIYGTEARTVELLLDANPGLARTANAAAELPFGTILLVPDRPETEPASPTRPWE